LTALTGRTFTPAFLFPDDAPLLWCDRTALGQICDPPAGLVGGRSQQRENYAALAL